MEREQIMQLQLIEQEVNQLNEQSNLIEQNIAELNELRESLDEINETKDNEILVNIGKKIYLPVEIKEKELIVEVGNKTFIKKTIKDTVKLINTQLEKLSAAKENVSERLRELDANMTGMIEQFSSQHECDENCKHE